MTLPLQAGIIMTDKDFLDGKRVLIVDDEFDILESLEELLPTCDITKTASFNEAKELLETEHFDIAILDIMGVDGYELLKIATERKVTAVMLTAYALSPDKPQVKLPAASRGASLAQLEFKLRRLLPEASAYGG